MHWRNLDLGPYHPLYKNGMRGGGSTDELQKNLEFSTPLTKCLVKCLDLNEILF